MYCWTIDMSLGSAQPLGIILHTAWLGGAVSLLLLSVLAKDITLPAGPPAVLPRLAQPSRLFPRNAGAGGLRHLTVTGGW
jgi:Flp pilus assembly protein protease CpaA